jgi:hypothetical protein
MIRTGVPLRQNNGGSGKSGVMRQDRLYTMFAFYSKAL